MALSAQYTVDDLPGLNCGVCGLRSCEEMATRLQTNPDLIKRCIYLSDDRFEARHIATENRNNPVMTPVAPTMQTFNAQPVATASACAGCAPTTSPMTS